MEAAAQTRSKKSLYIAIACSLAAVALTGWVAYVSAPYAVLGGPAGTAFGMLIVMPFFIRDNW